jgi:hypothetical protein
MVHLAQIVHQSCTETNTVFKQTETSFHLTLVNPEYHPVHPKQFSDPMVCLAQTVHLSCMKTNTTSKRTERRFYRTHVTKEFHRVRLKWFLRLWYVWCKLWIYLAPRLTLHPNGPKWDSTWPTSPRSSIESVQNDFRAYGTFGTNRSPILTQD